MLIANGLISIGLYYEESDSSTKFNFKRLFKKSQKEELDLDLLALLLDAENKLIERIPNSEFKCKTTDNSVWIYEPRLSHFIDGDPYEIICVELKSISEDVDKILFIVNDFSQYSSFIRIKYIDFIIRINDVNYNKKINFFDSNTKIIIAAELKRINGSWSFDMRNELIQLELDNFLLGFKLNEIMAQKKSISNRWH